MLFIRGLDSYLVEWTQNLTTAPTLQNDAESPPSSVWAGSVVRMFKEAKTFDVNENYPS